MNTYVPKPCCKTSCKRSLLNVDIASPIIDVGGGGILKLPGIGDGRMFGKEWFVADDDGGGGRLKIWDSLVTIRGRWESVSRKIGLLRWIESLFNDISKRTIDLIYEVIFVVQIFIYISSTNDVRFKNSVKSFFR